MTKQLHTLQCVRWFYTSAWLSVLCMLTIESLAISAFEEPSRAEHLNGERGSWESSQRVLYTNELSLELWNRLSREKVEGNGSEKRKAKDDVPNYGKGPYSKHTATYTPEFLDRIKRMQRAPVLLEDDRRRLSLRGNERHLNVFNDRPRTEVNETQYPYRAVGILSTRCTATVIQRNLLLTNWHCVGPNMVFFAGFNEGTFVAVSLVRSYRSDPMTDWAILETTTNIGDITGWFGLEFRDLQYFSVRRMLNMISYSGDHCSSYLGKSKSCRAMLSQQCGSVRLQGNAFLHDCSMTRGSSGSAMFRSSSSPDEAPVIIGYNFGEYRETEQSMVLPNFTVAHANAGRPSKDFQAAYQAYMKEPDEEAIPFCAPLCPPEFLTDQVCDEVCNVVACNFDEQRCDCAHGCPSRHVSDGKCDPACNTASCDFDGVDCLPTPSPVSRSPASRGPTKSPSPGHNCAPGCPVEYVNDTVCDLSCNVPECQFDGLDCTECAPNCLRSWVGDGMCDLECQVAACQFDGLDCLPTSSPVSEPRCAPGCYEYMVGDGICQQQCRIASSCRFDEGDCETLEPTSAPSTTTTIPSENCAPGCRRTLVNNGRCDLACKVEACDHDGQDCTATAMPTKKPRPTKRPTTRRPTKQPTTRRPSPTRNPTVKRRRRRTPRH